MSSQRLGSTDAADPGEPQKDCATPISVTAAGDIIGVGTAVMTLLGELGDVGRSLTALYTLGENVHCAVTALEDIENQRRFAADTEDGGEVHPSGDLPVLVLDQLPIQLRPFLAIDADLLAANPDLGSRWLTDVLAAAAGLLVRAGDIAVAQFWHHGGAQHAAGVLAAVSAAQVAITDIGTRVSAPVQNPPTSYDPPGLYDPYAVARGLPPDPEAYYRHRIALFQPHPSEWPTDQLIRVLAQDCHTIAVKALALQKAASGDNPSATATAAIDLSAAAGTLDAAMRTAHHLGTTLDPEVTAAAVRRALHERDADALFWDADPLCSTSTAALALCEIATTADLGRIRAAAADLSATAARTGQELRRSHDE